MAKYIAIGARTDCLNIVGKFAKLNSVRYQKYTDIWRELKFPYIYYGHSCLEELIEFTEEVLRIAKEIWLKSETLYEQVGGLYTVYGLYLKQPTTGMVKVRLTPKDFEIVQKFHETVKSLGHHDVNYVLARMFIIGAFHYCVSEYQYGLEKSYRAYHEKDRSLAEVKDEPLYIKRLKNDDIFNKLTDAFKEYHISKCNLEGEGSQTPPPLLRLVDPEFGQKLKEEFRTMTQKYDNNSDSSNIQKTETKVEPGPSKSIPQSENSPPGSSKSIPQSENSPPGSSKSIPQSENSPPGSSKSISQSENSPPTDDSIKLPWWLMRVRNDYLSKSDSESENDTDTDDDSGNDAKTSYNKQTTRRTTKNSREALNVALGMSGDEEEEDDENEKSQNSGNICEVGSSHHMPDLALE